MSGLALYNERELLLKVSQGDEKAFRVIFEGYRNRLYFYTLQLTSSREIAEDIVQDTFMKIWLRRDKLIEVEHFNGYIFRIAQNNVYTWLRRMALEAEIVTTKLDEPGGEAEPDDSLHLKLIKEVLQKAISNLPDQQKKVYTLRREEGLSIREIAKEMSISSATVKGHLTAAHKNLRETLEQSFANEIGILSIIFGLLG